MTRYILIFMMAIGLIACVAEKDVKKLPEKSKTPVSFYMSRSGETLNIDVAIPSDKWKFSSHLDDNMLDYNLVITNVWAELGEINEIRPIVNVKTTNYPSGHRVEFKFASKSRVEVKRNDVGLNIKVFSLEPDVERQSMELFGKWQSSLLAARTFAGAEVYRDGSGDIKFDGIPIYAKGKAGGRYYLDIFNVYIPQGSVKAKNLAAVNRLSGKTRLIFKKPFNICPDDKRIVIGKSCQGYSSLYNFGREKNNSSESFLFMLPGRPESRIVEKKGLVAFGFKNTRLFSRGLYRFSDGMVYKVETREKDGMLWLIFLYNGEVKFRKYYSGDKFFVVFYRGDK